MNATGRLIIEVTIQGAGIVPLNEHDATSAVQAFHIRVHDDAGATTNHLVTSAHSPRMTDEWCESTAPRLRELFPAARVCFTTDDDSGFARVYVPLAERSTGAARRTAAAVATVKRVCGWDESDTIRIELHLSGTAIHLSPRFNGEKWVVS